MTAVATRDSTGHDDGRLRRWRYRAFDATGSVVTGEIDAATERDAIDALRRRSLWATIVEAADGRAGTSQDGPRAVDGIDTPRTPAAQGAMPGASTGAHAGQAGVSAWRERVAALSGHTARVDLAVSTRAMATLLGAGVPLDKALAYAIGSGAVRSVQQAFQDVQRRVRGGDALSAACAAQPLFPRVFAPTIAAAEASGTLAEALTLLADHVEREEAVRARFRAALVYPTVLAVASVVGVTVMLLVVVPRFALLVTGAGATLPASTRLLIGVSEIVRAGWWALLGAGALLVAGWRRWQAAPPNRLRWHRAKLGWPVMGRLERVRATASYTRALSVALRAGVPLLSAMRLARDTVGNASLVGGLAGAEERVRTGGSLAGAVEGSLTPLAVRLLDAGEAGGNLAEMAGRASEAADADAQRAMTAAVALVEPVLILLFGGIVGFVALALLQAIYGINARLL